jgi:plasmid stabilization system protein ParE
MSRIELAPELGKDFDRILDNLVQYQVENPELRIREIFNALDVLEHNPRIGRPVAKGKRELVIGRRSHGYIALYRYIAEVDTVFVLALRSQREAGYAERSQGGTAP